MEPRARRIAIRDHLNNARAALEQGDRARARAAVEAALELDPDYLAAQSLRERIEREPATPWLPAETPPPSPFDMPDPVAETLIGTTPAPFATPVSVQTPPLVSAQGWMRFEQRALSRRIERRVAAARAAIDKRRFGQAKSILDEIREIDASHPDLISLGIELDAAQHLSRPRSGWWQATALAVLVVAALTGGTAYLLHRTISAPQIASARPTVVERAVPPPISEPQPSAPPVPGSREVASDSASTNTSPVVALSLDAAPPSPPPQLPEPSPVSPQVQTPTAAATESRSRADREIETAPSPQPATSPASRPGAPIWPPPSLTATAGRFDPPSASAPTLSSALPPTAPPAAAASAPAAPALTPAVAPAALPGSVAPDRGEFPQPPTRTEPARSPAAAAIVTPRDEDLVRRTIQLYRSAYDNLDARSAQAVWPGVDEGALQRAFSNLVSQQLTFDDCQVQVRGSVGSATCRGTTIYVPKVGNREPRREPRVWTFDLRKIGEGWQIDSARTER